MSFERIVHALKLTVHQWYQHHLQWLQAITAMAQDDAAEGMTDNPQPAHAVSAMLHDFQHLFPTSVITPLVNEVSYLTLFTPQVNHKHRWRAWNSLSSLCLISI